MRISEFEKNTIIEAVKAVDPDAKTWLFGPRTESDAYLEKELLGELRNA